jgi:hypothetical protein
MVSEAVLKKRESINSQGDMVKLRATASANHSFPVTLVKSKNAQTAVSEENNKGR